MYYMGIDHHGQYSHIILLEERGEVVNSANVATAQRLLTMIYRMVKENRPYIPHKR